MNKNRPLKEFFKRELTLSEKQFLKTLPPDDGDTWEDELRFKAERLKAAEYLPPLEDLIDLNYPYEEFKFTQAFLQAKSPEEIRNVIEAGVAWIKS